MSWTASCGRLEGSDRTTGIEPAAREDNECSLIFPSASSRIFFFLLDNSGEDFASLRDLVNFFVGWKVLLPQRDKIESLCAGRSSPLPVNDNKAELEPNRWQPALSFSCETFSLSKKLVSSSLVSLTAASIINFISSSLLLSYFFSFFERPWSLKLPSLSVIFIGDLDIATSVFSLETAVGVSFRNLWAVDVERSESNRTIGGSRTRPCLSRTIPKFLLESSPSISTEPSWLIGGSFK